MSHSQTEIDGFAISERRNAIHVTLVESAMSLKTHSLLKELHSSNATISPPRVETAALGQFY
eukprot:6198947-Amphidinium_carterae.1